MDTFSDVIGDAESEAFVRDGYLVLRGALSGDQVGECLGRLEAGIGYRAEDPATWRDDFLEAVPGKVRFDDMYTERMRVVASQLAGCAVASRGIVAIPREPSPVPTGGVGFHAYGRHIDGLREGLTLAPVSRCFVIFAYLHDTNESGGATVLYPGAHRKVLAYVRASGKRIDELWTREKVQPEDMDYGDAIPFVGEAGDAVIFHYLMPHGGSANYRSRARLGLNFALRFEAGWEYPPPGPVEEWSALAKSLWAG